MRQRHTVRSILHVEVPALNCASETFTLANCLNINKLADLEMSWAQTVANWKETFGRHFKLGKVSLCGQIVFEQVSNLGLLHLVGVDFANTNLDSVSAVFLLRLDLGDLTTVQLDHSAGLELAPLVPEVRAADLVSDHASALAQTIGFQGWN